MFLLMLFVRGSLVDPCSARRTAASNSERVVCGEVVEPGGTSAGRVDRSLSNGHCEAAPSTSRLSCHALHHCRQTPLRLLRRTLEELSTVVESRGIHPSQRQKAVFPKVTPSSSPYRPLPFSFLFLPFSTPFPP